MIIVEIALKSVNNVRTTSNLTTEKPMWEVMRNFEDDPILQVGHFLLSLNSVIGIILVQSYQISSKIRLVTF